MTQPLTSEQRLWKRMEEIASALKQLRVEMEQHEEESRKRWERIERLSEIEAARQEKANG